MSEASTEQGRRLFDRNALATRMAEDPDFAAGFRKAVSETIGEALREARHAAELNQRDVADRMGVSESRITQVEGEAGASITLRTLMRYSMAVGCRLDIELVDVATDECVSKVIVGDDYVSETDSSFGESEEPDRVVAVT